MKNSTKLVIYLLLMISLGACGKSPADATLAALKTQISLTVVAQLTATAAPTSIATPGAVITIAPIFTRIIPPTIAPTPSPMKGSDELQSSLNIETLDAFNGHNLRHISGWSQGFDDFEWMDSTHLLLYPIVGWASRDDGFRGTYWRSQPAVINLGSGKTWLPSQESLFRHQGKFSLYPYSHSPKWSAQLGALLVSETQRDNSSSVHLYTPDGNLLKTYNGLRADLSPTGNKILLLNLTAESAERKWIDLQSHKEVVFHWDDHPEDHGGEYLSPIWSLDETQVYVSMFFKRLYGNGKTGESFKMTNVTIDGQPVDSLPYFGHYYGDWVLNGTYMVPRWNAHDQGGPGFLPLFDPARKTYRNLSILAGLPNSVEVGAQLSTYPCDNWWPNAPGGRYIWVNCTDGGRLIDLQTFKAKTYPDYPAADLEWSADGTFAFMRHPDGDPNPQMLSAVSDLLKPIPADAESYIWHPKNNSFVYLSNQRHTLSIVDARSMSVQQTITLPFAANSPTWNHHQDKIILLAEDNSLWQMDYPALTHLEQLTSPTKVLSGFSVSPDDSLIAFYAIPAHYEPPSPIPLPDNPDLYIVDTKRKP